MTLELTVVVCLVDPRAKDEGGTRRENHVVEVHRALDCEVVESPYLARQLSVSVDRQLIMGLPETIIRGASVYAELSGKHEDERFLYWFRPS